MADPLTLCVFIDALGWEQARRTGFLEDLLPQRKPLQTVLGYSCTCDPTILTGKLPRDHGHFSFFAYAPERSPFSPTLCKLLGMLPRALTSRGRVRSKLSQYWKQQIGYTGYFQIYNVPFERLSSLEYTEKRDLYQPQGINNGCPTIFDFLRTAHIPHFCSDWRKNDQDNVADLVQALGESHPRFAYLYLAGMDALLHAEGKSSPKAEQRLRWYEEKLRQLVALAKKQYSDVELFVFSDHGMTDVLLSCPLKTRIEALNLTWGKDYAAVYDSTMARFWFLNDKARASIQAVLLREPHGRILTDDDLAHYGIDFADERFGELFFLMEPGVLLCPGDMGDRPIAGMHGYAPEHPDSVAFFGTTARHLRELPTSLTDLFEIMLCDVGLEQARKKAA